MNFLIEFLIPSVAIAALFFFQFTVLARGTLQRTNRKIIWHRLAIVSLCQGTKNQLIPYLHIVFWAAIPLDMTLWLSLTVIAFVWATESDDDHRKRKRRRQAILQAIKDFKIYGWQPGPQPT